MVPLELKVSVTRREQSLAAGEHARLRGLAVLRAPACRRPPAGGAGRREAGVALAHALKVVIRINPPLKRRGDIAWFDLECMKGYGRNE